jgi:glycosyltransferase involved in cell wall biosynthesis
MVRVLYLIENGSYRYDHRARREVCTLRDAGCQVVVICPAFEDEGLKETMDGNVEIYRYRYPSFGKGFFGHLGEYGASLTCMSALMAFVHAKHGFDVIHAVNPPDLLWTLVAPYKAMGKRFVFDHYDLNPELFEDKFGDSGAMKVMPIVKAAEKASVRLADYVISTNESYRQIAINRCGKDPDKVRVVRNGPDVSRFKPVEPREDVVALGDIIIGYLGNMNSQDGLDVMVEMARILRDEMGRDDIGYALVGSGDVMKDLVAWRAEQGLEDKMMLCGRMSAEEFMPVLSAAHICVQPDPPSRLNNVSTMNKPMEYMALGKPVITFALKETMVTGGDVCQYVEGADPRDLAAKVVELADDPKLREDLGRRGLERVENVLSWPHQAPNLLQIYEELFPGQIEWGTVSASA